MSKELRAILSASLAFSCGSILAQEKCTTELFAPAEQDPVSITGATTLPADCTLDFGDREVDLEGTLTALNLTLIAGHLRILDGGEIQGGVGATTLVLNAGRSHDGSVEILGAVTNSGDHGGDIEITAQGDVSVLKSGKLEAIVIDAIGLVTLEGAEIAATGGEAPEFGGVVALRSTSSSVQVSSKIEITGGTLLQGRAFIDAGADIVLKGGIRAAGRCVDGACGRSGLVELTAGGSIDLSAAVDVVGADGGTYTGDGAGGRVSLDANEKVIVRGDVQASGGELSDGGNIAARAGGAFVLAQGHAIDASGRSDGSGGGSIVITSGGTVEVDGELRANGGANADGGTIQITGEGDVALTRGADASGNYPRGGVEVLSNLGAVRVGGSVRAAGVGDYGTGGLIGLYGVTLVHVSRASLDASGSGDNGLGGTVRISSFQAIEGDGGSVLRASGDAATPGIGEGGFIELSACQVSFASSSALEAPGATGGDITIASSDGISLHATRLFADRDGSITLSYPPGSPPDFTGSIFSPDPVLDASVLVGPCPLPPPPPLGGTFSRGDCNGSQVFDISDPISLLNCLFLGMGGPPSCEKACDANDDGVMDISDASFALGYLFLGKRAPPSPFGECGADPTDDRLSCGAFAPCQAP
jgi:hypothetical protein